jgi:hypothetical protein
MTSPLIADYVGDLHQNLPAPVADEAADGLMEAYDHHRAAGASEEAAAQAALAEFGDLPTVIGEFTRQAPGRRAARLLLATGPAVGLCWAAAMFLGHDGSWSVPAPARLGLGVVLALAVLALAIAATSRHSYRRTRTTGYAIPLILALDVTAVTAALTALDPTWALRIAAAASLSRIALTARMLPWLAIR